MSCGFTHNLAALGSIIWPRFLHIALASSSRRAGRWRNRKHKMAGSVTRKHIVARSGRCRHVPNRPRSRGSRGRADSLSPTSAEICGLSAAAIAECGTGKALIFACGATCSQRWTAVYCDLLVAVSEPASEWGPRRCTGLLVTTSGIRTVDLPFNSNANVDASFHG